MTPKWLVNGIVDFWIYHIAGISTVSWLLIDVEHECTCCVQSLVIFTQIPRFRLKIDVAWKSILDDSKTSRVQ